MKCEHLFQSGAGCEFLIFAQGEVCVGWQGEKVTVYSAFDQGTELHFC